jgi:hypothetical protein
VKNGGKRLAWIRIVLDSGVTIWFTILHLGRNL